MKKHLSLFLALLLLVSVFFALPVEAAQPEKMETEQANVNFAAATVCLQTGAPRVTDPAMDGNAAVFAAGAGSEITAKCTHTYKTVQYDSIRHRRVCTKCNYSYFVAHSFGYTACGNVHNKHCSSCGYSVNESHTYGSTLTYLNENYHNKTCTRCHITSSFSHSFGYTDCGNVHNKHCSCGYSKNEAHVYGAPVSVSPTAHKKTCTSGSCNHTIQEDHDWRRAAASWPNQDSGHYQICISCQYDCGLVPHTMYCSKPCIKDQEGNVLSAGIMSCHFCSYFYEFR